MISEHHIYRQTYVYAVHWLTSIIIALVIQYCKLWASTSNHNFLFRMFISKESKVIVKFVTCQVVTHKASIENHTTFNINSQNDKYYDKK